MKFIKKYTEEILIAIAIVILLTLICSSCTTTKKHTSTEYIHDTIINTEYVERLRYDSIYLRDSIYMYSKGDTIYKDVYKYLYKYLYLKDTIYKSDTVIVDNSKETVKVVEDKSTNFKNRLTGLVLGVLVSIILVVCYKIKKKIK